MSTRIGTYVVVLIGLLLAGSPGTADAATKHAKAENKVRVQVVNAAGKAVGHARLVIRRAGNSKPNLHKMANSHGRYTTGSMPTGTYHVTARHRGQRSASAVVNVSGIGTHRVTVRMGRTAKVVSAGVAHGRAVHALGTKAVVKKVAAGNTGKPKPAHVTPAEKTTVLRPL